MTKVLELQLQLLIFIRLSNESLGLISFRIDRFELLTVQGTLKSLPQHHTSKSILWCSAFSLTSIHDYTHTHKISIGDPCTIACFREAQEPLKGIYFLKWFQTAALGLLFMLVIHLANSSWSGQRLLYAQVLSK